MSDDFVGGILPIDLDTSSDADFDPNAVESDDFLDDPAESEEGSPLADLTETDDDLLEEEI